MEFNKYARSLALAFLGLVGVVQISAADNYTRMESGNTVWFAKTPPAILEQRKIAIEAGRAVNIYTPVATRVIPAGTVVKGALDAVLLKPALARKFASALPGVGTALAIAEIVQAIGAMAKQNPDGTYSYTKPNPDSCSANCVDYRADGRFFSGAYSSSISGACTAMGTKFTEMRGVAHTGTMNGGGGINDQCVITTTSNGAFQENTYISERQIAPTVATPIAITSTELADMVAAKSGWPPSSAIAPFIEDMLKIEPMAVEPQSITGPVSSPGKVETTTAPDGKVTTNTTTNNYTYGTNNVSVTNTTTSNTYNPTTNTTTNNGTTTVTPGTPEPERKTACEENPKAMGCAELDTPVLEIPKVTKDVTYSAESMFSGGACPADKTIAQRVTGRPIVLTYTPTCNALANYVKPVIIAIALFMAYLIILPGRSD